MKVYSASVGNNWDQSETEYHNAGSQLRSARLLIERYASPLIWLSLSLTEDSGAERPPRQIALPQLPAPDAALPPQRAHGVGERRGWAQDAHGQAVRRGVQRLDGCLRCCGGEHAGLFGAGMSICCSVRARITCLLSDYALMRAIY